MRPVKLALIVLLIPFLQLGAADLGTVAFRTSATNPEAQAAFERGLAALHSFWYDEAADAFRRAEELEPDFAMAYWGEAMTFNHPIWQQQDRDGALVALAKLKDQAPTERERDWMATLDVLYGDGEKRDRDDAYEEAMGRLATKYPDDVDAAAFHALSILGTMHRDEGDARKQIRAAAILESLLCAHPDHPGVLHYMIHAYDDPLHAPLGLRAARRYAQVAPAAHHALHMPAHIFLQLGMWDDAASSNERAYAASVAWVKRRGLPSSKRDLHSLGWLEYVYLQQGRNDDARKLIDEVRGEKGLSDEEAGARLRMLARYAIETGTAMPDEPAAKESGIAASQAMAHPYSGAEGAALARGLFAAQQGNLEGARAALADLAAIREKKSDAVDQRIVETMETILRARTMQHQGRTAEAIAAARQAVELEKGIGTPSGPPDTYVPAYELLGDILLDAKQPKEALAAFRESLLRTPNRTASLRGAKRAMQPAD